MLSVEKPAMYVQVSKSSMFVKSSTFVLQGCCEHLLTFSDVRLLHPDDPQHPSAYPELVYQVL